MDECSNKNTIIDSTFYLIMDNDSGYVSNNLDQESNSDSLSNPDTSTVDILKSFLPKPVYMSEDALLECPLIRKQSEDQECSPNGEVDSPETLINSSVKSEKILTISSSFQTDTDASDSSMVIPIANAIYFELSSGPHQSPHPLNDDETGITNCKRFSTLPSTMCDKVENIFSSNDLVINENTEANAPDQFKWSLEESNKEQFSTCIEKNFDNSLLKKNLLNSSETFRSAQASGKCHILTPKKSSSTSNIDDQVLFDVTNTCHKTEKILQNPENTRRNSSRSRTNSMNDKENISQAVVFKTPSKGVKRKFCESASPDLFSDDENEKRRLSLPIPKAIEERFIHKLDNKLLKRVQKELNGVPPPPDFTITKFSVDDILKKLEENRNLFWTKENLASVESNVQENKTKSDDSFGMNCSILIEGEFRDSTNKEFPEILKSRHHGLHHNRNQLSEEIELLCEKYARRYIGAETQSTCCALDTKYFSPNKRKAIKQKWATKSPGRRLSHLARRRITFSSANLQSSSSSAASRARQILIDYKKLELLNNKKSPRKSPRKTPRKTPNKSPHQGRTPSSSAKKKLRMRFRLLSGDFKDEASTSSILAGSKRALFQSPENENKFRNILSDPSTSGGFCFSNSELSSRGSKRSLFSSPNKIGSKSSLFSSPGKKSPFKSISFFEKKRKRDETDSGSSNPPKLSRNMSADLSSNRNEVGAMLARTRSEGSLSCSQSQIDLSAAHKKKLQWAVYESLKQQNISTSHPQFKIFASVLARVTRRFILSSNVRLEGGTSERMFRIARHHSYAVVKGKSVEEIMAEFNKSKMRSSKPQGYIAPEESDKYSSNESFTNKGSYLKDRSNAGDSVKATSSHSNMVKPESRIDRIRKVINFEDR